MLEKFWVRIVLRRVPQVTMQVHGLEVVHAIGAHHL
eukprot:CAMPEP_0179187464 /NCGR_PEP_ID=MMETSP0796-20121207/93023_1 /TAXON_ID=73915 /ORGANISM="Pyrodinium bahamense, Strain pbaha01" /LENGTH=35 /DNA_ID= /DNA_START= /DNA_END= /DNA_ORIENTATION=